MMKHSFILNTSELETKKTCALVNIILLKKRRSHTIQHGKIKTFKGSSKQKNYPIKKKI